MTYSESFLWVGGGREEGRMEKCKGTRTSYVKVPTVQAIQNFNRFSSSEATVSVVP